MLKENHLEKDSKEPELSFYDVRMNCEPCRRILTAILEICEDLVKEDKAVEREVIERSRPLKETEDFRADLYEAHVEKWLDGHFRDKYPKEGITREMLRTRAKLRNETFSSHLRDHLLHYDILRQRKDKSYVPGENLPYRRTPEVVEFIKSVPASGVVWHGGVGFFNIPSFVSDKRLVRISQHLKNALRNMVKEGGGHLVLPDVIVLDTRKVLRSYRKREAKKAKP